MPCEAEIQERRVPLRRKKNVARLDVAVHPARLVQGVQRLGRLPGDPQHGRRIERSPCGRVGLERRAFQPRHDQELRRPLELRFQDRDQVRMGNLAAKMGLAGKHFDGHGVLLPIFVQHFDRIGRGADRRAHSRGEHDRCRPTARVRPVPSIARCRLGAPE